MQLENGNLYCWQWDTKQRLIIEEIDENLNNYIYIGNPKDKVGLYKMEIYDEFGTLYCDIPNEILQFAGTANIYLSEVGADKLNTIAFWRFTIKEREKPMDYVFYPTEQITIQMIKDELEETKNKVSSETFQEEIHKYFIDNPISEQELDPIATKTIEKHNTDENAHNNILKNKVDKVVGKQLSTNDFNNDYKLKLDNSITYQEQELTEEQKEQARVNIGAMSQNVSIPSIEGLVTKAYVDEQLIKKVNKEDDKGLSTNDFTNIEKAKLAKIEEGAQVNVQADYAQNDNTAPDYIKNRLAWTEYNNETIFEKQEIIISDASCIFVATESLIIGDKYLVNFDEIEYELEAYQIIIPESEQSFVCAALGNATKLGIPAQGYEDIPFGIIDISLLEKNSMSIWIDQEADESSINILEIIHITKNVRQISPEYYERLGWVDIGQETILPTTIINVTENGSALDFIGLQENQNYIVIWNDKEYQCKCYIAHEIFYAIGNPLFAGEEEDSGEPFLIVELTEREQTMVISEAGEQTLSIIGPVEKVHKIDEKFIPELKNLTWDSVAIKNTELFNEKVDGFTSDESYKDPAPFEIREGEEYEVVWDGAKYTVIATICTTQFIIPYGSIVIGNQVFNNAGNIATKEPFIIFFKDNVIYFLAFKEDPSGNLDFDTDTDSHDIIIRGKKIIPINLEYIPKTIPQTETAEIGQIITVKSVDENNKPIEWEAINSIKIDAQLSSTGQAADAKAVGEALAEKQPKGNYALKSDIIKELPVVSTSDDGKFLRVVAGQWAAQTILNAEEVAF